MEVGDLEEKELKHVCKFCRKSFACGRSLGGHMRSHMINDISSDVDGTKLTKKKLPPLSAFLQSNSSVNANQSAVMKNKSVHNMNTGAPGYVLREKPRRSWKFSGDPSMEDCNFGNQMSKSCRDCGKVMMSWKSLVNHMKNHCEKEREKEKQMEDSSSSGSEEVKKSCYKKMVMDSQSDNETAAPSKKKRSKRSRTRYMKPANSSSLSFPNNPSSSISQNEQEEVALSLIMLSRDVGHRGGFSSLFAESSDNNSVSVGEIVKLTGTKPEIGVHGGAKKQEEEEEFQFRKIGFKGIYEADSDKCSNPLKRKFVESSDHEVKPDSSKKFKLLEGESSHKFECTTCNKLFDSYQALGGHRASHKKIKGCFASKADSSENSIDYETSQEQASDSEKLNRSIINEAQTEQILMNSDEKIESKKSKGHECPICLKVFPSGQALGGHKRAHLVGGSDMSKPVQSIAAQQSAPPIRDFLDLNLPAPEEESEAHTDFSPWWLGTNHKCEQLLGLISN